MVSRTIATEGRMTEQTSFMGSILGPWVGLAWQGLWPGRAVVSSDQPCCAVAGTGADMGSQAVGISPSRDSQGWWCSENADAGEYLSVL